MTEQSPLAPEGAPPRPDGENRRVLLRHLFAVLASGTLASCGSSGADPVQETQSPSGAPSGSPSPPEPPPAATRAALNGPSVIVTGIAANFFVSLDGIAGEEYAVTLVCAGATVSPASVSIPAGQTFARFAVTAPAAGGYTVDFTISGSLQVAGAPRSLAVTDTASVLAQQAALLAPGQCILLNTSLARSTLIFESEGATMIKWGNSAYWDPVRREVGFIGKRDASYPLHWLVYDEMSNTWSNNRALWSSAATTGHGYDQNTIDPVSGDVYYRDWDGVIHRYSGSSWTTLSRPPSANIVGGLSWFPNLGLFYNDGKGLKRYSSSAWSTVQSLGGGSYHDWSEYNATANVLIFGGGNSSGTRKMTAGFAVSSVASPPFDIGAAETQGPAISDPSSAKLVAWSQSTGAWAEYDIVNNQWRTLAAASGSGSGPRSGTPPLVASIDDSVVACPIDSYGVQMWIQFHTSGSPSVWLYRHS